MLRTAKPELAEAQAPVFVMADGMPYFKPQKTPVESFEESLEDIEKQASLLFEEFLNLPQTANSKLNSKLRETSDSPVIRDHSNFKRGRYFQSFDTSIV